MGYTDSIERVEEWLAERISLLDEYFDYDPDGIKDLESAKHSITQPVARKDIRDRHLYIIRDYYCPLNINILFPTSLLSVVGHFISLGQVPLISFLLLLEAFLTPVPTRF